MKKILLFFMLLTMACGLSITYASEHNLVLSNGTTIYYKDTNINVMIPDSYDMPDTYFRGAWVTPLAGSIPSYYSDSQYKSEIAEMFDVLEYYNINALIFHIRIMNDALYPSKLNPNSSYMNTSNDMLTWVIEECHKRGIEFHAWLNPYRVQASGSTNLSKITAKYANYPENPASDANNLLVNSSGGIILNPCLENVRKFIVDTVIEVMDNYDVDAIHFDDYFYISDVDDDTYYMQNNPSNLSKSDWRREQVNIFIEMLHDEMTAYNKENNRYVQLGISPTGIYNNGDGVVTYDENGNAISSGSKTNGQNHYESYLFSDTLKWINNEWIDYICPQSYWAFSHPVAGYADVMSWWDKVVKYKKVNLYSGMGIYMSQTPGKNYSWGFDSNESVNQILYANTLENVDGTAFYSYNYLEAAYKGDTESLYGQGLSRIKAEIFINPAILPHVKSMTCQIEKIGKITVTERTNEKIKMEFKAVENAKFYIVYRSENELTYEPEEVYKIFGSKDETVVFEDNLEGKDYNYAIRVLAKDNSLSEPQNTSSIKYNVTFKDIQGNVLKTEEVYYGESATVPSTPEIAGKTFIGWSRDISFITSDLEVTPKYNDSLFRVTFYDGDEIIKTEEVSYKGEAVAPVIEKEGYDFEGWDKSFTNVIYDLDVYAIFSIKMCTVTILDYDDSVIMSYKIAYGSDGYYPSPLVHEDYVFKGWDKELKTIKSDIIVKAIYEIEKVTITLICDVDKSIIAKFEIDKFSDVELPEPPHISGFRFREWSGNTKNVKYNTKITAYYDDICYELSFVDKDGNLIKQQEFYWFDDPEYPTLEDVPGYTFIGWDTDLTNLPEDEEKIIISPIYEKNEIKVVFKDGNEIIKEYVLTDKNELANLEYPDIPEKEGYTFIKWDSLPTKWEDTEIYAHYEIKTYIVTFIGYNGEVINEEVVNYGDDANLKIDIPEVKGYVFKEFSSEGKNITEDITISLLYEKSKTSSCNFTSILQVFISLSLSIAVLRIFKKN